MIVSLQTPEFKQEINNAIQARQSGYEGKSRVCARRAAGIAILEFYKAFGRNLPTRNLFLSIQELASDNSMPSDLTQIAACFLERVNTNYELAPNVDLIKQAVHLCEILEFTLLNRSNDGK